jgi:hypothetical protein
VRERVSLQPFGSYRYRKQLEKGVVHCTVDVFFLEVTEVLKEWPECHERSRQWLPLEEAADAVDDAGLAKLLRSAIRLADPHH